MINDKTILGVVLARAGSKGLPGKNIKPLLGRPLLQYALEAGLQSQYIDEVAVSTDCEECIKISEVMGAEVPFRRPVELSGDLVGSAEVITHLIQYLIGAGKSFDYLILIEPTSPLRGAREIDEAIEMLDASDCAALVSVAEAEDQHPSFMFTKDEMGSLSPWSGGQFKPVRRQDVSSAFFLEGSVYISEVNVFLEKQTFCHDSTMGYVVPKWMAMEIDDIWDFICVEAIMSCRLLEAGG